jgi:hypothetical protein
MANEAFLVETKIDFSSLTKLSYSIAQEAHFGQKDKAGEDYINHPVHVASQMIDEVSICTAFLHDVVEDTELTFDDLSNQGIPEPVIEALKLLTHDDETPYVEYIQRIKDSGNKTAISVKLADLRHNSDDSRISIIDEPTLKRIEKYKSAIVILEGEANMKIEKKIMLKDKKGKQKNCCLFSHRTAHDAMMSRPFEELEHFYGDGEGYSWDNGSRKLYRCIHCGALFLNYKITFKAMRYEDDDTTYVCNIPVDDREEALNFFNKYSYMLSAKDHPYKGQKIWFSSSQRGWDWVK